MIEDDRRVKIVTWAGMRARLCRTGRARRRSSPGKHAGTS